MSAIFCCQRLHKKRKIKMSMRRNHSLRIRVESDSLDDDVQSRIPRKKSNELLNELSNDSTVSFLILDALWSGVILGSALPLGPLIARGYGYGGRWIGLWASLYYIGKLVGLIILKFTSTRGNRNNEQSGVNVNNATMLSKRVTFANDVGVNDINNCCTRLSWLKSQIYVFIHRLLPAGESSFRLVRRLVNLCDANTQQIVFGIMLVVTMAVSIIYTISHISLLGRLFMGFFSCLYSNCRISNKPLTASAGSRAYALGLFLGGTITALTYDFSDTFICSICLLCLMILLAVWASCSPQSFDKQGLHGLPVPWQRRQRLPSYSSVRSEESEDLEYDDDSYEILAVRNDSIDTIHEKDNDKSNNKFNKCRVNDYSCPEQPLAPSDRELASEIRRWAVVNVPARILRGCGGDVKIAQKRCALTALWRKNYNVDNLLSYNKDNLKNSDIYGQGWTVSEPQPMFHIIKELYPHVIHGKTSEGGHPIYIEKVGVALSNLVELNTLGVGIKELVRHYTLNQEFLWRVVCSSNEGIPDEDAQAVTLFDVQGVSMSMLSNMDIVRAVMSICQQHYVERSRKIFIVNAPFWFTAPWKALSPLLHPNTTKKVCIVGVGKTAPLFDSNSPLCLEDLPTSYGGKGTIEWSESKEEILLNKLVTEANRNYTSSNTFTNPPLISKPNLASSKSSSGIIANETPPPSTGYKMSDLLTPISSVISNAVSKVKGDKRKKNKKGSAHLGKENRFVYDDLLCRWVMEGDSDSDSDNGSESDEERLIRSIQAAHGYKVDEDRASSLLPMSNDHGGLNSYNETDNMESGFQSDTDDDTGYFSTNSNECDESDSFLSPGISSPTSSPRPWLATPPLPVTQPDNQSLIPELSLLVPIEKTSYSPAEEENKYNLVDVELGCKQSPPRTISETSIAPSSSSSSTFSPSRLSHRPQDNNLPTGVLVVYVLWRLLQTGVAYIVPLRILGVTVNQLHQNIDEVADEGLEYYLEGVGGRGVIITGGGCFLLGVLVMDWLFQACLRNLHRQSLARTLRASSLMQTISLILFTCLPSHISHNSSTNSSISNDVSLSSTQGEITRLLMGSMDSSSSSMDSSPRYIHESSLFEDVIATCGYAFFLGAIATCLIHKRAWIPSLPDVVSYESLPTWLLVLADALGAFIGPFIFIHVLTSESSLALILQAAVIFSVSLCIASACFGA